MWKPEFKKPTWKQVLIAAACVAATVAEIALRRSGKKDEAPKEIPVAQRKDPAKSKTAKNKQEKRARRFANQQGELAYGIAMAAQGQNNAKTRKHAKNVQREATTNALRAARNNPNIIPRRF